MEVTGVVIGAVALAGLFSTCVECFEYFKAAQELEGDYELLSVKLDFEKTRMLQWGNEIGLLNVTHDDAWTLFDEEHRRLLERALKCIIRLLSEADGLQEEYGIRPATAAELRIPTRTPRDSVSSNSMNIFRSSYKRFCVRFASFRNQPSNMKWAIYHKRKFEGLIVHLKGLIDDLYVIRTISKETQNQLMKEDISSVLNISTLKLIQAASEDSYREWSEVASAVIEASETGTVDRRNLQERIRDIGEEEQPEIMSTQLEATQTARTIAATGRYFRLFFVCTQDCANIDAPSICQTWDPKSTWMYNYQQYEPTYGLLVQQLQNRNSLTSRILNRLSLKKLLGDKTKMEIWQERRTAMIEEINNGIESSLPRLGPIYLYCPPCIRQIFTACAVIKGPCERLLKDSFELLVRVHPDLPTQCCQGEEVLPKMEALLEECDIQARKGSGGDFREGLDREWLEDQIYQLTNSGRVPAKDPIEVMNDILNGHGNDEEIVEVIIQANADTCSTVMTTAPFPWHSIAPKPPQAFAVYREFVHPTGWIWNREYLGTYLTRYNDRAPPPMLDEGMTSSELLSTSGKRRSSISSGSTPTSSSKRHHPTSTEES